ncbi:GTD2B protein, partial [Polyodon spathula]|nr:GTD2B protein [Polyodon spathula]
LSKRKIDKEGRLFQERWEFEYLFVEQQEYPICLVCKGSTAVMKRNKEKYSKFEGKQKNVSLSRNTVGERVDDLATNLQEWEKLVGLTTIDRVPPMCEGYV